MTLVNSGTGGGGTAVSGNVPAPPPIPVKTNYLTFQSIGVTNVNVQQFDVMVGDNPPTITGGYANWEPVKRPLQRALTVFRGYDPTQMTVEVRFGVWANTYWANDDATGRKVEGDINALESMAGSRFNSGPSPFVYVWAYGTWGGVSDLIPKPGWFATGKQQSLTWIITDLKWGKSYRNVNAFRTWQEATITLLQYVNVPGAPSASTLGIAPGQYVKTVPGRDTALKIANSIRAAGVNHQTLARNILNAANNNPILHTSIRLKGKSINWQIKHGVDVWVPGIAAQ